MLKAFSSVQFLFPKEQVTGLCFDGSLLRKAVLRLSGSSCLIQKLETVTQNEEKNAVYASCIPSSKTLARTVEIALTKQKDIDATFAFEAESHLPYPLDECIVDKVLLSQNHGSTTLQLFSVRKADINELLESLNERSFDPEALCPKPLAICHFVQQLYMKTGLHIVLHVDNQETTAVLIQDGLPVIARSHPMGLDGLSAITYIDENGQTSINENELVHLQEYLREISRILLAFQNGFDSGTLPILFCGPIVENALLMQLFTSALERENAPSPEQFSQKTYTGNYSWQDLLVYALPIGLALCIPLEQRSQSINLRKDEFAYKDKWRRWKKELWVYFCLMMLLSAAGYLYGKSVLKSQHNTIVEQYATLLQTMEKPVNQEEILGMSTEDIQDRVYTLEDELKISKEEMALHPDVPRVSDLLAWLSSHPNIVIGGDDPKAIHLESMQYNMVKRPEKGKLKEHYQVRVELEFSSPSPTMARELHDALLAPNAFVDPKTELKWSVHRGHFKATFFLKDRTKYPQQIQSLGAAP